jgi:hypothetical protein
MWELLQNAVDTAESCRRSLNLTFTLTENRLVFEHDGGPFKDQDLAALILAGSAKPFDNSPYVGRFGTGFLVTHAISKYVYVSGKAEGYPGGFALILDRRGSEEDIQRQIDACYEQLERVQPEAPVFARFEYLDVASDGAQVAVGGLRMLDKLLPYVFAFNRHIDSVAIDSEELKVEWKRDKVTSEESAQLRRLTLIRKSSSDETNYEVYIGQPADECFAAAAVKLGQNPEFLLPESDVPRVYRNFPLVDSEYAGLPIAIHAPFDVDEHRSALFLAVEPEPSAQSQETSAKYKNHKLAVQMLAGLPDFLCHLAQLDVRKAHTAVAIRRATGKLANAVAWNKALRELVDKLVAMPIVKIGLMPYEHTDVRSCLFLRPIVDSNSSGLRVSADEFWTLASKFGVALPAKNVIEDWEQILSSWAELGVKLDNVWDVRSMLDQVRKCKDLVSLGVAWHADETKAVDWIADLLKLLTPISGNIPSNFLSGVLPNQKGTFATCTELFVDDGVAERLKDIAEALGFPIRTKLLDSRILISEAQALVAAQVPNRMDTIGAAKLVAVHGRTKILERNRTIPNARWNPDDPMITATAELLIWFAVQRPAHDAVARDLPLLSAEGKLVTQSSESHFLLPVEAWQTEAQKFVEVFPESKRLASLYWKVAADSSKALVDALVEWGTCFPDLIYEENDIRLKGKLVQKLAVGTVPSIPAEAEFTCAKASRIPILSEAVGRISNDRQRAGQFFNFLITYVIERDDHWREQTSATWVAQRGGTVTIRPSEWLGQVLKDAWVPESSSSDESSGRVVATPESLHGLVPWDTVGGNPRCAEFLQLLGFDQLEVWIQSNAGGDTNREALLRAELAGVAQAAGSAGLAELRRSVEQRRANQDTVAANRQYGLYIQGLVKKLLEARNKTVDVIDRGYDFCVYEAGDADIETDWGIFDAGAYLVEVKAARTDEVRMSPLQAKTAVDQASRYVLCAVDLRNVLAPQPSIDEVAVAIRIVGDIGIRLRPLFETVTDAATRVQGLRIDETRQLRYCIDKAIWATGQTVEQWIIAAF